MSPLRGRDTLPPRRGVSAAIFRDGHVLLVQRAKPPLSGLWSLPGGHLMTTETALAAAHRELAEETGVKADLQGIVDVRDVVLRHGDGSIRARYALTVFYGAWLGGDPCAASDCCDARWVEPADLGAYRHTEGLPPIVAAAVDLLARRATTMGDLRLQGGA